MSEALVFTVAKADPVDKEPTVGAVLNITADLGQGRETLPRAVWRAANLTIHVVDAQQVVAALSALPQGTIDQVLVLLLQQRASLLRVAGPFPPPPGIQDLPDDPTGEFVCAVTVILDEAKTFRPALPPVTPESAASALWFALRHLVPAAAKEGA